jgi:hypothetical protein
MADIIERKLRYRSRIQATAAVISSAAQAAIVALKPVSGFGRL